MECRGCRRRWCWAPCSDAPKNLPPAASSHTKKKKKPIKNNLGGNEISIIDCKAVYPTHLKCRRRWRRPESPHAGRGCMHARLERRRREKKGVEAEQRGEKKQTNRRGKKKRNVQFESKVWERGIVIVSPTRFFFFFFCAPAKVSRVGSNGKGKRWSEPISHIRGGLFAPSLSCA